MPTRSNEERWAIIPGYDGRYSASDLGRIRCNGFTVTNKHGRSRRSPEKIMSIFPAKNGYMRINLYVGSKIVQRGVHQYVMLAFFGPPPHGHVVNHKDTNKANNRLGNLEYVTQAENAAHAASHGLLASFPGESNPMAKLRRDMVMDIKWMIAGGFTDKQLAKEYEVSKGTILLIRRGKTWKEVPIGPWRLGM